MMLDKEKSVQLRVRRIFWKILGIRLMTNRSQQTHSNENISDQSDSRQHWQIEILSASDKHSMQPRNDENNPYCRVPIMEIE